jgi:ATP-dependent helicase YprA (DUF1998 family)
MSARQQAGRAGRSGKESLVVLVAGTNALDQYYMRNPADFLREAVKMLFSTQKTLISLQDTCSARQKRFLLEHLMRNISERSTQEL